MGKFDNLPFGPWMLKKVGSISTTSFIGNPIFEATKAIDIVLSLPTDKRAGIAHWYLDEMKAVKVAEIGKSVEMGKISPSEADMLRDKLGREVGATHTVIDRIVKE